MKKTSFMIIAILLFSSGCVMLKNEEWTRLQKDVSDMGKENDALKIQMDSLRSKIQDVDKIVALEKTLTNAEKDIRKKQADIVVDMTALRADFQVLTGRFEETRYAMQKSAQEEKNSSDEFEIKLKETAQMFDELQKRLASVEQITALIRQDKEPGKENASGAQSVDDAYKDAYETFQKGEYIEARDKFQKYLEDHPSSKYSENALFWIGESYYNEKNYEKAIVIYDDVIKKYPNGGKAPAALLKQGMAFSLLGDKKNASVIYKKIIERYPKSEQAEMARKKMKE